MRKEQVEHLLDTPEGGQREPLAEEEIEESRVALRLGQAPHVSHGLLERAHGFLVGVAPRGALRRAGQVLDRLGAVVGLRVVVREAVVRLLEAPGVERLERASGGGVEGAAIRLGQARVGDLLDQRVLEGVDGAAGPALLVQELEARELLQVRTEGPFPDRLEEFGRELAA